MGSSFARLGTLRRLLPVAGAVAASLLACAPAEGSGEPLRWAPPALVNPTTITLGQGFTMSELDPARDYIVKLPPYEKLGATVIKGGHNVVVEGGYISIPPNQPDDAHMRGIYIKDNVGTVHIEGVKIDGSAGGMSDGIDIAAPQSTVQVENVRVTGLMGGLHTFHADVMQPWGGVGSLRVDRLTGSSNYQGLFIPRDLGDIGSVTLNHVNLSATPGPYDGGGHMLWITPGIGSCLSYPLGLADVYAQTRAGTALPWQVWPQRDAWFGCPNVATADGGVTWPSLQVSGEVQPGPPPGGDYVPEGVAGLNYTSPGYADGSSVVQVSAPAPGSGAARSCSPCPSPTATPNAAKGATRAPDGAKRRAAAKHAPATRCRSAARGRSKAARCRQSASTRRSSHAKRRGSRAGKRSSRPKRRR